MYYLIRVLCSHNLYEITLLLLITLSSLLCKIDFIPNLLKKTTLQRSYIYLIVKYCSYTANLLTIFIYFIHLYYYNNDLPMRYTLSLAMMSTMIFAPVNLFPVAVLVRKHGSILYRYTYRIVTQRAA
jgi:hypothetical protein